MNFIEEFKKGQAGANKGFYMGDGIKSLSDTLNGIQKHKIYGIASPSKTGKSTLIQYAFVISPYLDFLKKQKPNIEWVYFSFEIDRVSMEFDFASYFLFHDFNKKVVFLDNQKVKINGDITDCIPISSDYLRGRILNTDGEIVKVSDDIVDKLKVIYRNRIVPLFGEYNSKGILQRRGFIDFQDKKQNPTGIYKYLMNKASKEGSFIKESYGDGKSRIIGYNPKDNEKITIVIIDHVRKVSSENGMGLKQIVDKTMEYAVELRNLLNYTFVPVIHTNRNLSSSEKIKFMGEELYPTSDDLKDTSNIEEDCDYLITMFNPYDEKYQLKNHFGLSLYDGKGNQNYKGLRTLHLVMSRYCFFPQHFKTIMEGNIKNFKQ